jgi:uncharacterized radical SAM protein YgiQ
MADPSVLELARALDTSSDYRTIRGLCYLDKQPREDTIILPSFEEVSGDKQLFTQMFHTFYQNNDPLTAKGLSQQKGDRYLIQNPPALIPDQATLDSIYALDYELDQHPYYAAQGPVKALETIKFSISTHRGCYGECNFCAIAVHEGRTVRWRSQESILNEARRLAARPDFKGYIQDVGGPTANMYGIECVKKLKSGACPGRRCLSPEICPVMRVNHAPQLDLLREIRKIPGIKKVFVASGIRYDMLLADKRLGHAYLKEVVEHHTSGQLKIAPEHTEDNVLQRMGKPGTKALLKFKESFDQLSAEAHKEQFLTYYFIAAYPGCTEREMQKLKLFASQKLKTNPEQVQIFTPTPSTYASLMYYTEMDPFTGQSLFVEKDTTRKERQKQILTASEAPQKPSLKRK